MKITDSQYSSISVSPIGKADTVTEPITINFAIIKGDWS